MDEDTRLFLEMLDAAAERVFEAHAEIMAAESSAIAVSWSNTVPEQTPSFQQNIQLSSENQENAISCPSELSSSPSESRKRKKRCRTSEQPSWQQPSSANWMNLALGKKPEIPERDLDLFGWPKSCFTVSDSVNKTVQESKESLNLVKNHDQLRRKRASGIRSNMSNATLTASTGNISGIEGKEGAKFDDFSKEIEAAITRIESLIPSLQKLVNPVHTPNKKSARDSGLPDTFISIPDIGTESPKGRNIDGFITKKEVGQIGKPPKQVNQMLKNCDNRASLLVNQSQDVVLKQTGFLREEAKPKTQEIKLPNLTPNVVSTRNDSRVKGNSVINHNLCSSKRNLELEKHSRLQTNQVRGAKGKGVMDRVESQQWTPSRNDSATSQRIMPCQFCKNNPNQNQTTSREAVRTPVSSEGSTNFAPPVRTSRTRGRNALENRSPSKKIQLKDLTKRNTVIKKNIDRALVLPPHYQGSEEESSSSLASSSRTSERSGSQTSSSGTYQSTESGTFESSDESESWHGKLGESSSIRKQYGATEISSGYATSSYYTNTRNDEYSDEGVSSERSLSRPLKERGKGGGRFKRLKKKLGAIFHHHHHHHHHHHYGGSDHELDVGHARSFWKRLGKMFHHTRKGDREKPKVEKSSKSMIKSVPKKKKQQGGNFHALVGGLMRHMRHSKKSKQAKDDIGRLVNGHHKGKKGKKNVPWWPKIRGGRGGVKVSNKGRVKLGNRTKRPPLASAAKMLLRQ